MSTLENDEFSKKSETWAGGIGGKPGEWDFLKGKWKDHWENSRRMLKSIKCCLEMKRYLNKKFLWILQLEIQLIWWEWFDYVNRLEWSKEWMGPKEIDTEIR